MEFLVVPKGSKFIVEDRKNRLLYTIKKKGFGGKFILLDASGYNLYNLVQKNASAPKPEFTIILNDDTFMELKCTSKFLDPSIEGEGQGMTFTLKSTDRKNFQIIKNNSEIGSIATVAIMTGELQYEITIENNDFDDYIPLFAIAIERCFGDMNKRK